MDVVILVFRKHRELIEENVETGFMFASKVNSFPVSLRIQLISAGLDPVLSHTEKSFIV